MITLLLILLFAVGGLILGALAVLAVAGLGVLGAVAVPALVGVAGLAASGIAATLLAVVTGLGYAASYAFSGVRALVTERQEAPVSVVERNIPERQLQAVANVGDKNIPFDLALQCQELKLVPCPV